MMGLNVFRNLGKQKFVCRPFQYIHSIPFQLFKSAQKTRPRTGFVDFDQELADSKHDEWRYRSSKLLGLPNFNGPLEFSYLFDALLRDLRNHPDRPELSDVFETVVHKLRSRGLKPEIGLLFAFKWSAHYVTLDEPFWSHHFTAIAPRKKRYIGQTVEFDEKDLEKILYYLAKYMTDCHNILNVKAGLGFWKYQFDRHGKYFAYIPEKNDPKNEKPRDPKQVHMKHGLPKKEKEAPIGFVGLTQNEFFAVGCWMARDFLKHLKIPIEKEMTISQLQTLVSNALENVSFKTLLQGIAVQVEIVCRLDDGRLVIDEIHVYTDSDLSKTINSKVSFSIVDSKDSCLRAAVEKGEVKCILPKVIKNKKPRPKTKK